jgi:hypothetical protein
MQQDDMDPEEAEEELLEELRLATVGQPSFQHMLLRRQAGQRALRDSETGRSSQVGMLLARGGRSAEKGKVYHIAPIEDKEEEREEEREEEVDPSSCFGDTFGMDDFSQILSSAGEGGSPHSLRPDSVFSREGGSTMVYDLFSSDSKRSTPSNNPLLNLLDNDGDGIASETSLSDLLAHDVIPTDEVDKQWQVVIFGRCPDPVLTAPIKQRRANNITSADSLYADMLGESVSHSLSQRASHSVSEQME